MGGRTRRASPTTPHHIAGHCPPERAADRELDLVTDAIRARDPDGSVLARVLRDTYDQLYDGQRTGRYSPTQLMKTEKTHMGTLVEINIQRAFDFSDGEAMDYSIAGSEVDCKFSRVLGGWMLPREAYRHDHLCLVVWADEEASRWEAGLVRAGDRPGRLGSLNQDLKRQLTPAGESEVRWLFETPSLPENLLLHIDAGTRDRIFYPNGPGITASGQERVNQLFRSVQRRIVNRASLLTVAMQRDSLKRARDARLPKNLGSEGILVLGHQDADPSIARELGLAAPSKGDFISTRVHPVGPGDSSPAAHIDGGRWRVAKPQDPVVPAPRVTRSRA